MIKESWLTRSSPVDRESARHWFRVLGQRCAIFTNSTEIHQAARCTFRQAIDPQPAYDLSMSLWVDPNAPGVGPWPQPHFRGLNHLVYVGLDHQCSLLLDLRRRRAIGRVSPAMGRDLAYWQRVIFPNAIGLMSEALGLTALHCACLDREGVGLLLSGGSGAGKSTLALALARRGFAFLSDDWTYFSGVGAQLRAWGLAGDVKLLPDATRHFPELGSFTPAQSPNGELAYELDPEAVFDVRHSLTCEPRWLVFLERRDSAGYNFTRMHPLEAAIRLEGDMEDLPSELLPVREAQTGTIRELAGRECWLLSHGELPSDIAQILARLITQPPDEVSAEPWPAGSPSKPVRSGPDILRRFTATPLRASLRLKDCEVRLETNSPAILRQISDVVGESSSSGTSSCHFLWRLISDEDAELGAPWPAASVLSADGLHLEHVGLRTFFAVDSEARLAVGFVAEGLLNDPGFERFFAARLVSATSAIIDTFL